MDVGLTAKTNYKYLCCKKRVAFQNFKPGGDKNQKRKFIQTEFS